jgi:hypothetical protein
MVGAGQGRARQKLGARRQCSEWDARSSVEQRAEGRQQREAGRVQCAVCSECGRACRLVESAGFPRPRRRLHQTPTAKARV